MNDKIAILSDATLVFFSFEKKRKKFQVCDDSSLQIFKYQNGQNELYIFTYMYVSILVCSFSFIPVYIVCTCIAKMHVSFYTFNAYEHYCIVWVLQQYFNSPCIKHWVSLKVFLTLFNQLQTSQTIRVECLSILPRKDMHSYCSLGKVLCEIL